MTAQCFGEAAARLWSAAAKMLGWSPDQFWDATPVELVGALIGSCEMIDAPDATTIDALRARFPDYES